MICLENSPLFTPILSIQILNCNVVELGGFSLLYLESIFVLHYWSEISIHTGQSLWMKSSPEMNFEKDSLLDAIDNLKDDQEIQKELSLSGTELHSSNEPNRTMVDTHAMVKSLMAGGMNK